MLIFLVTGRETMRKIVNTILAIGFVAGCLGLSACDKDDDNNSASSACQNVCRLFERCYGESYENCRFECVEDLEYLRSEDLTCYNLQVRLLQCVGRLSCDDYETFASSWPDEDPSYPCRSQELAVFDGGCWY
jgi:hypothetical protein